MALLNSLSRILRDPPPALVFELSEAGVAMARLTPKLEMNFHSIKPGVISVSPLRDNILIPDELLQAVRALAPPNGTRKRRDIALIVPDYCTRVSVLDFDEFPSDVKEQQSLVRFRIRKSIPFDVELAAMSYWPQPAGGKRFEVVTAVAPLEIIARYEAPFRAAGLNPGLVVPSALAALRLVSDGAVTVVAKLTGRALTVMVLDKQLLKLVRCLELAAPTLADVAADLFPTFVYVEDSLGARAERLLLCGFGERTEEARQQFQAELGVPVEPVRSALGTPGEYNAGLLGFVRSIAA